MSIKTIYIILWGYLLTKSVAFGQLDPMTSQYFRFPMQVNPALTGAFGGDLRASAIHRNQWLGTISPLQTAAFSADLTTNSSFHPGVQVLQMQTGGGAFRYTQAYATLAYDGIRFGTMGRHQIRVGFLAGILNRSIQPGRLQFGDQWNQITGFQPGNPTTEVFDRTSTLVPDLGFGLAYFDTKEDGVLQFFGGGSAFHINRPEDKFIAGSGISRVPIRWVAHGGFSWRMTPDVYIVPHAVWMRQGTAEVRMVGMYTMFPVNESTDFMIGANFRWRDALVPYAGLTIGNFTMGVSYDIPAMTTRQAFQNTSAFEITLSYMRKKSFSEGPSYMRCPRF